MTDKPDLRVVEIDPAEYRQPVQMLRNLADDIEAGEHGEVSTIAIVLFGDRLDVFCGGPDSSGPVCALMLQAGALRFAKAVERA